ncbi:MAG TPA: hypothetical protein VNU19_07280 [Candidatus Acidoferrum sp.]|jgi:hypothetical protein|nr:hypothetical protein [Candidatus Acidoferrum sp.]
MLKFDEDRLTIVPAAPPDAGPDRALDPAEPLPAAVGDGDMAVADGVPQAASPITANITAPAISHRLLAFESNRLGSGVFMVLFGEWQPLI